MSTRTTEDLALINSLMNQLILGNLKRRQPQPTTPKESLMSMIIHRILAGMGTK